MQSEEVQVEREHTPASRRWRSHPGQTGGQSSALPQVQVDKGPHLLLPLPTASRTAGTFSFPHKTMTVQHFLRGF